MWIDGSAQETQEGTLDMKTREGSFGGCCVKSALIVLGHNKM